uniref:Uncharacterized protein n=1 Tax=Panagrolaimus sp. JU765 TaxID=591449 RepID=A0AC34QCL2_9BILA
MVLVPRGLHAFALGLFVTGCAPAGGASNFWTLLLDGNVHLSVTMTFISMIASVFMIPFWMKAVGYKFVESVSHSAVKVPYRNIMTSLIVLIVPLLIGMGIARKWPSIAAKARRALRPFIIFVLIFVIALGTLTNLHIFKQISLPALLSGFLLPFGGFMFGCITSILLGQKPRDVTAIAIETGIQNTGIAIMLLKFSFPDADTAMLIPVIVACFTPFPLLFSYGVHSLIKYVKNRPSSLIDVEKENQSVIFHANENVHKTAHCQSYDERPLIRKSPDLQTEEGRVEYLEQVLDQVLLPGVIPD